ncbi:hypothetical protein HETIRDRAFT_234263, partial [Heterobasidion irregulare TC 32-1]
MLALWPSVSRDSSPCSLSLLSSASVEFSLYTSMHFLDFTFPIASIPSIQSYTDVVSPAAVPYKWCTRKRVVL